MLQQHHRQPTNEIKTPRKNDTIECVLQSEILNRQYKIFSCFKQFASAMLYSIVNALMNNECKFHKRIK